MYDLGSFAADFILAEGEPYECGSEYVKNARGLPVSLYGAICKALEEAEGFREEAARILGCTSEYVTAEALLELARETDICRNISCPVEVYIDPEWNLAVHVYDDRA
jgi:hypothetical protein